MSLLTNVAKGLFGITFGTPGVENWLISRLFNIGQPFNVRQELEEPYANHVWVRAGLDALTTDVGDIGWELYASKADEAHIYEDPILDVLNKPNRWMTGLPQTIAYTVLFRRLFGECFWYYPGLIARRDVGKLGRAGEIVFLDPRRVVYHAEREEPWYFELPDGTETVLVSDFLTQFKYANPYNPVRGLSPLAAATCELEADFHAAKWNRNYFQNGATPSGLLIPRTGAQLRRDQRQDILSTFESKHGGGQNRVGIIPAGWEFKDFGINHRDMDFRILREASRDQLLALIGVLPFRVGIREDVNFATAREQKVIYYQGSVVPELKYLQGVFNHDFLPKLGRGDVELWPKYEAVSAIVEDQDVKSTIAQRYWSMGVPLEQINERLELGFDTNKIDSAKTGWLPMNMMPADAARELPAAREQAPALPEARSVEVKGRLPQSARALVARKAQYMTADLEARYMKTMRAHMKELAQEVLNNLDDLKEWRPTKGITEDDIDEVLFDEARANKRLASKARPMNKNAAKRGGEAIVGELGIGASFNSDDPLVLSHIAQQTRRTAGMNATVRSRLAKTLSEGVQKGETTKQLAARVVAVRKVAQSRAAVIAQTEVAAAFNAGRVEGMRQSGVEKNEWLTVHDSGVRESHAHQDGMVRRIGDAFPNGLRWPGDYLGDADEVANCRCIPLPVV